MKHLFWYWRKVWRQKYIYFLNRIKAAEINWKGINFATKIISTWNKISTDNTGKNTVGVIEQHGTQYSRTTRIRTQYRYSRTTRKRMQEYSRTTRKRMQEYSRTTRKRMQEYSRTTQRECSNIVEQHERECSRYTKTTQKRIQ